MSSIAPPATASDVIAICGHLDDDVIARIVATGATAAEVLEAFTWCNADDQIGTELLHSRRGAVGEVYEILMSQEPEADELR